MTTPTPYTWLNECSSIHTPPQQYKSEINYRLRNIIRLFPIWLLIAGLLQISVATAAPSIITSDIKELDITQHLQYLPDKNKTTINQILEDPLKPPQQRLDWQSLRSNYIPANFLGSRQWLKLDIQNHATTEQSWYLALEQSTLHSVSAYLVEDKQIVKQWKMGDQTPFYDRPVEHRHFLIPIELGINKAQTLYVNLHSASISYIPVSIQDQKYFWINDAKTNLFFGLYFGIFLVMVIYNLFIYCSVRELSYLVYGIYVSVFLLLQATINGYSFQFFWPSFNQFNAVSPVVLGTLSLATASWFILKFLQLQQRNLSHYYFLAGISIFGCTISIATLFIPYVISLFLASAISLAGCTGGCYIIIKQWRDGNKAARFVVVAWLTLLACAILYMFDRMGLIVHNPGAEFALLAGSVLEIVLLSFAIADRINIEKLYRFETQNQLIDLQKQANENLETQVESRTSALQIALKSLSAANESLLEISTTDSLTGVKNRRFFDSRFDNEYRRSRREQMPLSILLVDIDRFKDFNDSYGHIAGDICIRSVAQALESSLKRPCDSVSRYGGEEFCLILSNTDKTGALHIAEKIRRNIEALAFLLDTGTLNVTVSIGVSSVIPGNADKPELVLHTADLALYEAKENGRNQVRYRTLSSEVDSVPKSSSA